MTEFFLLKSSDIKKCPTLILWPPHYRKDGTCRHDEPNCEYGGCIALKYKKEIFCKPHLKFMGG